MPTLLEKIISASSAGLRFLSNGLKIVSQEQHDERAKVCGGCILFDKDNKICNKCGCHLEVKWWMPTEKCPENKWLEVRE